MKSIRINAYAKVNLSLDVIRRLENGYHQVKMVMQQIKLCDEVLIRWFPKEEKGIDILLKTDKYYLPTDERNLAYKAAVIMRNRFAESRNGTVRIDIKKNIPVAAGLAGGSSNGAAVLHGLNMLWGLQLSLADLCEIGAELGSDVPFTVMGQAKANKVLYEVFKGDRLAATCAVAEGTGTKLYPLPAVKGDILLSKPPISVSTGEVYQHLKLDEIKKRPNNDEMVDAIEKRDIKSIQRNMVNVLEEYTLTRYDIVGRTKEKMIKNCPDAKVLMSGSGPSIFALAESKENLKEGYRILKDRNKETYLTRTII